MNTFIERYGSNLLYILIVSVLLGCNEPNVKMKNTDYVLNEIGDRIKIIELDSCEYMFYEGGHRMAIAHKGNCKFCAERNKK